MSFFCLPHLDFDVETKVVDLDEIFTTVAVPGATGIRWSCRKSAPKFWRFWSEWSSQGAMGQELSQSEILGANVGDSGSEILSLPNSCFQCPSGLSQWLFWGPYWILVAEDNDRWHRNPSHFLRNRPNFGLFMLSVNCPFLNGGRAKPSRSRCDEFDSSV